MNLLLQYWIWDGIQSKYKAEQLRIENFAQAPNICSSVVLWFELTFDLLSTTTELYPQSCHIFSTGSHMKLLQCLCWWNSWLWKKWGRLSAGQMEKEMEYSPQVGMHMNNKAISKLFARLIKWKWKLSSYWKVTFRMLVVLSLLAFSLIGGAISNMYSVMVARYKHFPEVKTKGMTAAPRLVLFTSEHVCIVSYWKNKYWDISDGRL